MSALSFLVAAAAWTLSLAAAGLAIASLAGGRDGRADALASFAPFALAMALAGALLGCAALGPGPSAWILLGADVLSAALSVARVAPEIARRRPRAEPAESDFRILTANVCRSNPLADQAVEAILARDADAVLLQEAGRRLSPSLTALDRRYPHLAACPHSGLRIYSKSPILAHACSCERAQAPRGRLLTATIAAPDGGAVTLATTHFSHPYRGDVQARERAALASELGRLDVRRLILAGDFNTTPWSHGMACQDALLKPLRRRTIAWFTWPSRLPKWRLAWPLPALPIDHVYAPPAWGNTRLRRVRIPGSDHFATEVGFSAPAETQNGRSLR